MSWPSLSLQFAHPRALYLLAMLAMLSVVAIFARIRRRRALARLGSRPALEALASVSRFRRGFKSLCGSWCLALVIVAIAGPQWGFEPEPAVAVGRDLVVVVDLSRSMQAEDVLPNRLGRARQSLVDLVNVVQKTGGHRVGLIAFAGQARIVCPLTPDYDHFREAVANLDPEDPLVAAKPAEEGTVSGTRIGQALKLAVELHDARYRGHQDILLLSDGDDPARDDEWSAGADLARQRTIPIYTIGIGNPDADSIIPAAGNVALVHDGKEVHTRLDERPLEEIARVSGGVYLPARLDVPPLEEWFRVYVRSRPAHAGEEELLPALKPRYAWFFGAALGLFTLTVVIGDRPRSRRKSPLPPRKVEGGQTAKRAGLVAVAALVLAGAAPLAGPLEWVREGNAAFRDEDYERALDLFTRAEERITDPGLVSLNKAAALYRLGQYRPAELHYLRALEGAEDPRRAHVLYDLGNAVLKQAQARKNDVKLFDRAIGFYQDCLRDENVEETLQEDARHNLKIAQTLRAQAKPASERDPDPDKKTTPDDDPRRNGERDGSGSSDTGMKEDPNGKAQRIGEKELGTEAKASQRPMPGPGNLEPVPDDDVLKRLPPEEAAEHLRRAAAKILAERKEARKATVVKGKNVLNW